MSPFFHVASRIYSFPSTSAYKLRSYLSAIACYTPPHRIVSDNHGNEAGVALLGRSPKAQQSPQDGNGLLQVSSARRSFQPCTVPVLYSRPRRFALRAVCEPATAPLQVSEGGHGGIPIEIGASQLGGARSTSHRPNRSIHRGRPSASHMPGPFSRSCPLQKELTAQRLILESHSSHSNKMIRIPK